MSVYYTYQPRALPLVVNLVSMFLHCCRCLSYVYMYLHYPPPSHITIAHLHPCSQALYIDVSHYWYSAIITIAMDTGVDISLVEFMFLSRTSLASWRLLDTGPASAVIAMPVRPLYHLVHPLYYHNYMLFVSTIGIRMRIMCLMWKRKCRVGDGEAKVETKLYYLL